MKKFISALLVATLAVTLCVCLVACSAKLAPGTYKFSAVELVVNEKTGKTVTYSVGDKYLDVLTIDEDFYTLEINKDGTAILKSAITGNQEFKCNWKKEKGKYYLTSEDFKGLEEPIEIEVDGDTLTFSPPNMKIILTKK